MRTINFDGGRQIKLYSSAKEMPIGRYSDFQKYLISDTSFDFLVSSLKKSKAFLEESKFEDCSIEINNSLLAVLSLRGGVGTLSYAFAVMVAEIDYKTANDTTIDGLNAVIEQLKTMQITQQDIEDSVEDLKKK